MIADRTTPSLSAIDFQRCFSGRRVLVTGHTGFKGGWLSGWLLKLGAEVTGISLMPPDQPNLFEAMRLSGRMASRILDIRHLHELIDAIEQDAPEIVFHLAAQPLVRQSYADPIGTFETNVLGTANVLEASLESGRCRRFIDLSTSEVFGRYAYHVTEFDVTTLGAVGARTGGAEVLKPTVRVTFWGALAMAITAGVGLAFGAVG